MVSCYSKFLSTLVQWRNRSAKKYLSYSTIDKLVSQLSKVTSGSDMLSLVCVCVCFLLELPLFSGAKLYEKLQVQRRQQTSMQKELMRKKCSTEVRTSNIMQQLL